MEKRLNENGENVKNPQIKIKQRIEKYEMSKNKSVKLGLRELTFLD